METSNQGLVPEGTTRNWKKKEKKKKKKKKKKIIIVAYTLIGSISCLVCVPSGEERGLLFRTAAGDRA